MGKNINIIIAFFCKSNKILDLNQINISGGKSNVILTSSIKHSNVATNYNINVSRPPKEYYMPKLFVTKIEIN